MHKTAFSPRKAALIAEFMTATRGVPVAVLRKALADWVGPFARFGEKTKAELAMRYAKGRLSLGGSIESQRMRRLTPEVLNELGR
ncbi:MAG: hypothetical protein BroJett021_33350 [Chloroflexota bacterium]|nr:MAG: hypothetical protein BroJett021_33350 [Chloroflexota bacterium]